MVPPEGARTADGNAPSAQIDWPRRITGLSPLMALSAGSPDVSVALIDGPLVLDHPDLATENIRALDGREHATCIKPIGMACAHGTYVAGVLHAKRDAPAGGICPGCTLLVHPIFSDADAVVSSDGTPNARIADLSEALLDVIEAGARIVNLSVGLAEPFGHAGPVMDEALDLAVRRGVIIVAAAGNQATVGGSAITRHPWVVPVVACNRSGHILSQSNLGASIGRNGVTAPGHDISSLSASGGHSTFSGSSAAVPFVTGAMALLWSVFPAASASQIRLAVTSGRTRRRSVTPPLLDAWAAYQALSSISTGARAR
jgi:subtilisin family serine protease